MTIYKTKWFDKWSDNEGLSDKTLCRAVEEMSNGLFDADLGSGLFKKRVSRKGQGKSSGYRTLVATNKDDRWFFVYGFPKNARSNITKTDEKALKMLANELLSYTPAAIEKIKMAGEITEVKCNEENEIHNT
ncbi:MAG: type II toxin-antitoxin system RelE/ParE family toxin [Methylosarcina sp.]